MKNRTKSIFAFSVIFLMIITVSYSQLPSNESYYYTPTNISRTRTVTLPRTNSAKASNDLNAAILSLSNAGGGTLMVNAVGNGNNRTVFLRDVKMRNNVLVKVNPNITIQAYLRGARKNVIIIGFGNSTGPISNVGLTSQSQTQNFKFRLFGGIESRVKCVEIKRCTNFLVSNIFVNDDNTVFSNIELNIVDASKPTRRNGIDFAYKGLIKNITSINNHTGYGVVQIRAGKRILFKKLKGTGGITLRMESGFTKQLGNTASTIDGVVGRNITVIKGMSAMSMSPHRCNQGVVDIRGINSRNSTYGVEIGGGFKDAKGGVNNAGVYSSQSIVKNINYIPTTRNLGQVKQKDFKFYSCSIARGLQARFDNPNTINPDKESVSCPSLSIVKDASSIGNGITKNCTGGANKGCYNINLDIPKSNRLLSKRNDVVLCGLNSRRFSINESSLNSLITTEEPTSYSIFPNPASEFVTVSNVLEGSSILIYDISGKTKISTTKTEINISQLKSGIYFLVINSKNKSESHKLVIL